MQLLRFAAHAVLFYFPRGVPGTTPIHTLAAFFPTLSALGIFPAPHNKQQKPSAEARAAAAASILQSPLPKSGNATAARSPFTASILPSWLSQASASSVAGEKELTVVSAAVSVVLAYINHLVESRQVRHTHT